MFQSSCTLVNGICNSCTLLTFKAPTAPAGQKTAAKCAEAIHHCALAVRQQIYTAIAAESNAHCRRPGDNHEKQKYKTKTNKIYNYWFVTPYSTSFNLQPLPPPSTQVSIISSEAGFSLCSHPNQKEPNRQSKKKKLKKYSENYNTENNNKPSSLSNSCLNVDNVGCIPALSDNKFHHWITLTWKKLLSNSHLGTTTLNMSSSSINGHNKFI